MSQNGVIKRAEVHCTNVVRSQMRAFKVQVYKRKKKKGRKKPLTTSGITVVVFAVVTGFVSVLT